MTVTSPDYFSFLIHSFHLKKGMLHSFAQPCTALHSPQGVFPMTNTASHGFCAQPCTATDESCMSHIVSHSMSHCAEQGVSHMQGGIIALTYIFFSSFH